MRPSISENYFHTYISQGEIGKVAYLISKNNNLIHKLDNSGKTPLKLASDKGHLDIVDYLTDKGATK